MGGKLIGCRLWTRDSGECCKAILGIDPTDVILESKIRAFGCGTAIASSDTMAELCKGKTVDEAVKITNIDVEKAMRDEPDTPAVPPQKMAL